MSGKRKVSGNVARTTHTNEPVNVKALSSLACRVASGKVCWPGSEVTIRRLLHSFLAQVDSKGFLPVTWYEGPSLDTHGFATRRFSGVGEGVKEKSLFCLPRLLRSVGRSGLSYTVDVDQDNCHLQAQLLRHPSRPALLRYVRHRDEVLGEILLATGVSRDDAKVLMLQLVYGGSAQSWCSDRSVSAEVLPAFVAQFTAEQLEICKEDAEKHPELMAKIRASGAERPEVTLQSLLNMRREREVLDAMCLAVRGVAEIASYEHDGLFLYSPTAVGDDAASQRWQAEVMRLLKDRVAAAVSIKEPMSFEGVLEELERRWPGEDWRTEEDTRAEEEQVQLVQLALQRGSKLCDHLTFAKIVYCEGTAYEGHPYAVTDLFKNVGNGGYQYFDVDEGAWSKDDARDQLLHVVMDVLARRVRSFSLAEGGGLKATEGEANVQFMSVALARSVEEALRPMLKDRAFQLDGDDSRRHLVFSNGVYDREDDKWVPRSPAIRSSHCTGWAWKGSGLSTEEEAQVEQALESVGVEDATVTDEAAGLLVDCGKIVPALGFLFDICGSWDRALYCTKHLARATFALQYQEHLWTRGPGANGKDTLANLMQALLGTYFGNLPCEALTGGREMDAPSQTLLSLKGKRFAAVREIARNAKIKSHVYKTIADPKGKLKARGLYGRDEEFSPHFLLYLCSNVPVDLDDSSGGSARRTRILDLPFNFVEDPEAANEKLKDAALELRFESWRPTLFFLLCLVYRRFLKGRNQTNVTPVPQEIREAVDEELEEPWMEGLAEFIKAQLDAVSHPRDASSAVQVREAFARFCPDVPKKEAGLRLARKGFAEETVHYYSGIKRSTKRVYRVRVGDVVSVVTLKVGCTGGS
jgi:hypothetical protein